MCVWNADIEEGNSNKINIKIKINNKNKVKQIKTKLLPTKIYAEKVTEKHKEHLIKFL